MSGFCESITESAAAKLEQALPIVFRVLDCEGCGREFWPTEEHYREHWVMWREKDGLASGVRIECRKCHGPTPSITEAGGLRDQQLVPPHPDCGMTPGWVGARALFAALALFINYSWPKAADRERIGQIAEAMSFAHLAPEPEQT